jgi:hypothetical protein
VAAGFGGNSPDLWQFDAADDSIVDLWLWPSDAGRPAAASSGRFSLPGACLPTSNRTRLKEKARRKRRAFPNG